MKFSMTSFALTMLTGSAVARYCTAGLKYCAPTLRKIGDYEDEIVSVCEANQMDCKGSNADDVLFDCLEGPVISSVTLVRSPYRCAGKCLDGGSGKSDYCG